MDSMNRRDVFGALAAMAALGVAGMDAQAQAAGEVDLSKSQVFRFSEMVEKKSSNGGWSRAVTHGTLATGEFCGGPRDDAASGADATPAA
jgi:hypothetical protein